MFSPGGLPMRKPAATPWACLASMSEGCSITWPEISTLAKEPWLSSEPSAEPPPVASPRASGTIPLPRVVGLIPLTTSLRASLTWWISFGRSSVRRSELGKSFEAIYRRSVAPFADRVRVHKGNLLDQTWPADDPIEILFVDVAKTLALSGKVLTEFFTRLIPGKSLVIQQDFYHPTAFYLPVVMDFLADYFTIIEAGRDWSVVFKLETAIPREKLEVAGRYEFSFVQQHSALRRMMRRVGMPGRDYLRLSECAAIGTTFGEARFQAALDHAIRRSSLGADRVWSDGLNWCKDFNASRIRTRFYGAPSLMPPPTFADEAYIKVLASKFAIASR